MKRFCIIILLLMAVMMVSPLHAEFYRYTDAHGNVIFTDDLSKIPADQRDQAKLYEASKPDASAPSKTDQTSSSIQDSPTESLEADRKEGERLQSLKTALDQEYNALAEERSKLLEEQKQAVTPEQNKAFNDKVVNFNARLKAHQEKTDAFKSQVDAYNRRLEAAEAKPQ